MPHCCQNTYWHFWEDAGLPTGWTADTPPGVFSVHPAHVTSTNGQTRQALHEHSSYSVRCHSSGCWGAAVIAGVGQRARTHIGVHWCKVPAPGWPPSSQSSDACSGGPWNARSCAGSEGTLGWGTPAWLGSQSPRWCRAHAGTLQCSWNMRTPAGASESHCSDACSPWRDVCAPVDP